MTDTLTPKQQRFVEEYLVDLNATQAAIRAGYSADTARQMGSENLSKPDIQEAIQRAQQERSAATGVKAERVVQELARMAFYDPAELVKESISGPGDIQKLPEDVRRAIIGWSWDKAGRFTLRLSPKTPSLDLLARHLGMLVDRNRHEGPDGGPVQVTYRWAGEGE